MTIKQPAFRKYVFAAFLMAFLPWTMLAAGGAPVLCFESDGHVQLERAHGPDHVDEHDHEVAAQSTGFISQDGVQGSSHLDLPLWAFESKAKPSDSHNCNSYYRLRSVPSYTFLHPKHLVSLDKLAAPSPNPDLFAQRSIILLI